ncbi:MAG: DedA family protein [bacterium]|nr:DedA family protein [bacterium]
MLESLINTATNLIVETIAATGYWGVFLFMTAESALIPIPSEIIMPFSGLLAFQGKFSFWLVVSVGAAGNLVGSLLAYGLGYWGQDHYVRKFIRSWGKFLLLSEEDYEFSVKWFKKYGSPLVFFSRILPIVRTFISLPAGITKLPLKTFIPLTFLGSFLWSALLTYIGLKLRENWHSIGPFFRKFDIVIIAIVIILVVIYFYKKMRKK